MKKLTKGDIVRVIGASAKSDWKKHLSDTRYEVVAVNGHRVSVREINEINPSVRYRATEWDASMFALDTGPWEIGDYAVIRRGHHYGVMKLGGRDFISTHDDIYAALAAVERYREGDERRRA